jgi:Cu/Ag efflux pump CusA
LLIRDVGEVSSARTPSRRGPDGMGDTVGIVVMRHGENARAVIERVANA